LSPDEVVSFNDAIWLYVTCAKVANFNHDQLRDLQLPVLTIKAIQTGFEASKATSHQCNVVEKLCV
jgi:hypothetical protein